MQTAVPLSAMSELALRMYEARDDPRLTDRIGRAIDSGANQISLTDRDRGALLIAVERHRVVALDELRLHLLKEIRAGA